MSEEWRPVQGFPNYEVSSLGRIRSWQPRGSQKRLGYLRAPTPHVMSQKLDKKSGYFMLALSLDGKSHHFHVHYLVCRAWNGERPRGWHTRHLDGNKLNNTPSNLEWGTAKENKRDQIEHDTWVRGERSGHALLTEEDVKTIRGRYVTIQQLADEYGVSVGCIKGIVTGRKWKHIPFGSQAK